MELSHVNSEKIAFYKTFLGCVQPVSFWFLLFVFHYIPVRIKFSKIVGSKTENIENILKSYFAF